MSDPAIELLRKTNHRVQELMTHIHCAKGNVEGPGLRSLVEHRDLDNLRGELKRTAVWLQGLSSDVKLDPEWAQEISDYRERLEALRELLPAIHDRLLAERSRMEGARTHLTTVTAWTNGSKRTLLYFK